MKKYIVAAVGVLSLTFSFANAQEARSQCGCYDAPIGDGDYVTKEYVDSKFQPLFQKLDNINSRVEALSRELSGLKNSDVSALSSKVAQISSKVSQLESALNDVKNTCPSECNSKLVQLEKNIAELKEKIEKRTQHMEKEVEKSMRK